MADKYTNSLVSWGTSLWSHSLLDIAPESLRVLLGWQRQTSKRDQWLEHPGQLSPLRICGDDVAERGDHMPCLFSIFMKTVQDPPWHPQICVKKCISCWKARTASCEMTDKRQKISRPSFLKVKFFLYERRIGRWVNRAEAKRFPEAFLLGQL